MYQNNKSSNSKIKFRQASNHCKKVLEVHYFPETYGSQDFWQISVLSKGKSPTASIFNSLEVLSSAADKAKFFAENFSKNSNLDDSGISLPVFPSRTNLKLHNISVTPKMV